MLMCTYVYQLNYKQTRRKKTPKCFPVLMTALLYHVVLDLLTDHDHLHLGHQGAVHVELCDHEVPGHLLLDVDGHGADLEADQQGLLHLCGHALQGGCDDQLELEGPHQSLAKVVQIAFELFAELHCDLIRQQLGVGFQPELNCNVNDHWREVIHFKL